MRTKLSCLVVLSLALLVMVLQAPLAAQNNTTPSDISADEVNDVARELWCPLCSGVRLDSCELKACDQMKDEIAIKLSEGEDTEAIKDYFVNQYGPQVLGEPPRTGFNLLAWILPVLFVVGGGIFLIVRGRAMLRPPDSELEPIEEERADAGPPSEDDVAGAIRPAEAQAKAKLEGQDADYASRLDEELKSYD